MCCVVKKLRATGIGYHDDFKTKPYWGERPGGL